MWMRSPGLSPSKITNVPGPCLGPDPQGALVALAVRSLARSWWPGQGSVQERGSQPCLACLPADSSGTVSWLPAKLPPLRLAGIPGAVPGGRLVGSSSDAAGLWSQPGGLRQAWVLGPPATPRGPREPDTAAPALSTAPRLAPPRSWDGRIHRDCNEKSTAGAVGPQTDRASRSLCFLL